MSPSTATTFTCVSCHVEIRTEPVFHVGLPFCCAGCVAGGPCICSYDEEPVREPIPLYPERLPVVEPVVEPVVASAVEPERLVAARR
jgi:hypothetical protein